MKGELTDKIRIQHILDAMLKEKFNIVLESL